MTMNRPFSVSLLLATVIAVQLHAQQADSTRKDSVAVVLPPIEATGSILPTAGAGIGSGIPARISIVTGKEIDAWEPRLVADALATQPGISTYDDLGTPWKMNLSTRGWNVGPVVGLPPGVSVFLDGVPQNEPDAAEVNFDLLPMEHIERIELLSGTASLLGPNSLGGAVNLITKRGQGPLSGHIEGSGGSYGDWSGEGTVGGSTPGGLSYYAGGGYERENGWREATYARNYDGFFNIGKSGGTSGIFFQGFGAKAKAGTAGSVPESIFNVNPADNFTPGDVEDLDLLQLGTQGYVVAGTSRFTFGLYYRRSNAERFNVNQAPDPNVRSFTYNRTVGGRADWRWATTLGRGVLSLRAGVDGRVNRVQIRLFNESTVSPGSDTLTTDAKSPSGDAAGFALVDYTVGRLTFSGGARYDYVRIPFRDLLDPTADTTSSFTKLSPRGGVNLDAGNGVSLYTSVGQSFRAPAILELACADSLAACPLPFALGDDPPLKPIVATSYEVGGKLVTSNAILSASVYRTDVKDDIGFIASDVSIVSGYFANIGKTRREGVELSLQLLPRQGVSLYANYAYTLGTYQTAAQINSVRSDSAFASSPLAGNNDVRPGDQLPTIPKHQIKAGGLVRLTKWVDVGADMRFIGQQWLRGDEANQTRPLDSYFVANVRAGLTFGPWEINTVVNNLFNSHKAVFGTFNENRVSAQLERFLTPMNARSVKVIVSRQFGAAGEED